MKNGFLIFVVLLTFFGCKEKVQFPYITNLDVDDYGNYYVAAQFDVKDYKILKLDKDFNLINSFGAFGREDGNIFHVNYVNVGKDNKVYITNTLYKEDLKTIDEEQVLQFDSDGNFIKYILRYKYCDDKKSNYSINHGFWMHDIDNNGNIYITNSLSEYSLWKIRLSKPYYNLNCSDDINETIKKMAPEGGRQNNAQATVASEYIIVSNIDESKILFYDQFGSIVRIIGNEGFNDSEFYYPYYAEIDRKKRLVVGDYGNKRLQVFDLDGSHILNIPFIIDDKDVVLYGLSISQDNEYIITDNLGCRLLFFSENGTFSKEISYFYDISYKYPTIILVGFLILLSLIIYRAKIKYIIAKIKLNLIFKIIIIVIPLIIITCGIVGLIIYEQIVLEKMQETQNSLLSVSNAISNLIDMEKFNRINKTLDIAGENYNYIFNKINNAIHGFENDLNPSLRFIIPKIKNSIIYYGVDSFKRGIYLPLSFLSSSCDEVIKSKKYKIGKALEQVVPLRYFFYAISPILNEKQELMGLVVVLRDSYIYDELAKVVINDVIVFSLAIISIISILIFFIIRIVLKPINKLKLHLNHVGNKMYEQISFSTRDEIGDLIKNYNLMINKILENEDLANRYAEDKAFLAKEIHDRIGAWISTIRLNLSGIIKRINDATALEVISHSVSLAENELWESRNITAVLTNIDNDLQVFIRYLKTRCHRLFDKNNDISLIFDNKVKLEYIVSPVFQINVLSAFQEALINIRKHSKTTHVVIDVEAVDLFLNIHISDFGIGFDIDKVHNSGLSHIKDRIKKLNGDVIISSVINKGTTIKFVIPLAS